MHRHQIKHTLTVAGVTITYELTFTRRKTLAIRVHPDTRVSVYAPLGSNLQAIEASLARRAAWIMRHQRVFEARITAAPPRLYITGETEHFLGQGYYLVVRSTHGKETVEICGAELIVSTRSPGDSLKIEKLIDAWLHQEGLRIFSERVAAWYLHFASFGPHPQVAVRSMRSRWGSCSAKGKITFTTRLVRAPIELIDYVVVHELCHLKERNHGPRFYQLLAQHIPDWKARKKLLAHI